MPFIAGLAILIGLCAVVAGGVSIFRREQSQSFSLALALLGLAAAGMGLWVASTR